MSVFENIEYLNSGNIRQQKAFKVLTKNKIFEILQAFDPVLTGTIPIAIDLPESDLDISCFIPNKKVFKEIVATHFSTMPNFQLMETEINAVETIIANFQLEGFELEIFGQAIPSQQQNAYRHMVIEHQILLEKGEDFKQQIIALKRKGLKTEPAFAELLQLSGDPYEALLAYKI